jgi:hypothetical protein
MGCRRELNVVLDRAAIQKILDVAKELDVNKGGLYDARAGCVNIWCSPEDKPQCWPKEVLQGTLNYPRDYVAGIYWEWNWENDKDRAALYLEVEPYELERHRKEDALAIRPIHSVHRQGRGFTANDSLVTNEEWEELFAWSLKQTLRLLSMSGLKLGGDF